MSANLEVAFSFFFFFNDTATTEIYTLSLHDALPIYFGEVRRPGLQLVSVGNWYSEHFSGHDSRKGIGKVCDDIHAACRLHGIEQRIHDLLDVGPQNLDPAGGESRGSQTAQPSVGWRVHEQHLFHHHLCNWTQSG